MSFDSLGRYQSNHKPWDHVGNVIPDVEHSEGERPACEFKPASWLPVQFFDKHYENWNVVMPGKAVALDPDGRVMPAQYGLTGASVVYSQSDVDAGTIDIATGLAVTTTKTVVLSQLTGVRGSAWTLANAGTTGATHTSGFMGRYGSDGDFDDATAKYPIGIAPYAYLKWAGGDGSNPANFTQHNYQMQHQVAVLCDYVVKLPLIPAQAASETVNKTTSGTLVFGTTGTHTRAQAVANATGRYNASTGSLPVLSTYTVVALALDNVNLATQTSRTLLALASDNTADDVSGVLVNEMSALSAVQSAGDYFVDEPVGVIFIYSSDGATLPTSLSGAAGTVSLTYYHNTTAASTVSKFASVLGPIKPGDFVKVTADSNLVTAASSDFRLVVGQVLALESHPRDALDRVRTAYNPAINTSSSGSMANGVAGSASVNLGQMDQMPGSANGGFPAGISYAGAADLFCIINLVSR